MYEFGYLIRLLTPEPLWKVKKHVHCSGSSAKTQLTDEVWKGAICLKSNFHKHQSVSLGNLNTRNNQNISPKRPRAFINIWTCLEPLTKLTERVLKTQMLQYFLLTIRGGSMGNRLKQSSLKNTNTMLQFVVCFTKCRIPLTENWKCFQESCRILMLLFFQRAQIMSPEHSGAYLGIILSVLFTWNKSHATKLTKLAKFKG